MWHTQQLRSKSGKRKEEDKPENQANAERTRGRSRGRLRLRKEDMTDEETSPTVDYLPKSALSVKLLCRSSL